MAVICITILGLAFLSVNLFPSINNDGVEYIAHSSELLERGLVHLGYRQPGYPILLTAQRLLSGVLGVEALLLTTFAQRLVLLGAAVYAVWLWRWRALPILVLMAAPSLMAYTNLIMTEALTISLAIVLACSVSHFLTTLENRPYGTLRLAPTSMRLRIISVTSWAAGACAFWLLLIRLPFAVFGAVPLGLWLAARRGGLASRAPGVALIVYLALSTVFGIGLVAETSRELGVTSPNARSERAAHWAAWQNTFTLHPENRTNPALATYFNDGNPYITIWDIEDANPRYVDQARALESATRDMLGTAGIDIPRARLFSLIGSLGGGRLDELRPRLEQILATDAATVDDAIHVNDVSRLEGRAMFVDRYNDGHKPQAVITSPLLPGLPLPYLSALISVLLPLSLIGVVYLAARKRRWIEAMMFVLPVLVYSAYLSWFLADNVRFLATTSLYAVSGLCALWAMAPRRVYPTSSRRNLPV